MDEGIEGKAVYGELVYAPAQGRSRFDGWVSPGAYTPLPQRDAPRAVSRAGLAFLGLAMAMAAAVTISGLDRGLRGFSATSGTPSMPAESRLVRVSEVAEVQASPLPLPMAEAESREEPLAQALPVPLEAAAEPAGWEAPTSQTLVPLAASPAPRPAPRLAPINVTGFAEYQVSRSGLRLTRLRQDTRLYFFTKAAPPAGGAQSGPQKGSPAQDKGKGPCPTCDGTDGTDSKPGEIPTGPPLPARLVACGSDPQWRTEVTNNTPYTIFMILDRSHKVVWRVNLAPGQKVILKSPHDPLRRAA